MQAKYTMRDTMRDRNKKERERERETKKKREGDLRDRWRRATAVCLAPGGVADETLEFVELGDDVAVLEDGVEFFLRVGDGFFPV